MMVEDLEVTIVHLDATETHAKFSASCTVSDVARSLHAKARSQWRMLHKDQPVHPNQVLGSLLGDALKDFVNEEFRFVTRVLRFSKSVFHHFLRQNQVFDIVCLNNQFDLLQRHSTFLQNVA